MYVPPYAAPLLTRGDELPGFPDPLPHGAFCQVWIEPSSERPVHYRFPPDGFRSLGVLFAPCQLCCWWKFQTRGRITPPLLTNRRYSIFGWNARGSGATRGLLYVRTKKCPQCGGDRPLSAFCSWTLHSEKGM